LFLCIAFSSSYIGNFLVMNLALMITAASAVILYYPETKTILLTAKDIVGLLKKRNRASH